MGDFTVRKAKRRTNCKRCNRVIERKNHIIQRYNLLYCLNCGEVKLKDDRKWFKKEISDINKALRSLRRYPKERVVQKLS